MLVHDVMGAAGQARMFVQSHFLEKTRSACNAIITPSTVGLIRSQAVLSRFSALSCSEGQLISITNKNLKVNHFGMEPQNDADRLSGE